jgi:nucleotide-binding universal stress UspA family protein
MDGNAVESILKLCKLNIVDLLIIGALEKENILKYYTGSVARKISRKAKCSVLLLTQPHVDASKPKKIIVSGSESPKTINTINAALYLAEKYKVEEITVVKEVDTPLTFAIAEDNTAPETREMKKNLSGDEEKKLNAVLSKCNTNNITVNEKIVNGKQGYAISKYARDKKADLLVVNSPDKHLNLLDRIFTHDLEYILADLPCNVLIVHSRV